MKNIYKSIRRISGLCVICLSLFSCEGFFMTPMGENINQDKVFENMYNAERALNAAYFLVPYNWPYEYSSNSYDNRAKIFMDITAAVCDEAVTGSQWTGAAKAYYGQGAINPLTVGMSSLNKEKNYVEYLFEEPYYYIRRAYVFLENVDQVGDATPEWIAETTSQAKLLVAMGYYELIRRYGSVPYVDQVLNATTADLTRMPLADLVDIVDQIIEESIPGLPDKIDETDPNYGRVTKSAAYFLRSRLWLTMASPLFNTNTPAIEGYAHPELVTMMSAGNEQALWKKAVDCSKEAIDYIEAQGYRMIDTGNPQADYTMATRDIIGNTEMVLFSRRIGNTNAKGGANTFYGRHMPPRAGIDSKKSAYTCITQNHVDKYRKTDGTELTHDAYNCANPWADLDPRFHATVVFDGSQIQGITINTQKGDPNINVQINWTTGYFLRKFFHDDQYANTALTKDMAYINMRLPELYLNYAEALNEYSPNDPEIENYLNRTIERVDMPRVSLAGLSQDEVREEIRRERAVELAIEDHRFFDVKRWMIADKTIGATKYGALRSGARTDASRSYTIQKVDDLKQTEWSNERYLMPFPQEEILKEKGLIQNPGY